MEGEWWWGGEGEMGCRRVEPDWRTETYSARHTGEGLFSLALMTLVPLPVPTNDPGA